jgi:hypothetical protein
MLCTFLRRASTVELHGRSRLKDYPRESGVQFPTQALIANGAEHRVLRKTVCHELRKYAGLTG